MFLRVNFESENCSELWLLHKNMCVRSRKCVLETIFVFRNEYYFFIENKFIRMSKPSCCLCARFLRLEPLPLLMNIFITFVNEELSSQLTEISLIILQKCSTL